jgi:hypothetical protein
VPTRQVSAQRPRLTAATRGLSGMVSGDSSSIASSRVQAARRGSAEASGLRLAVDVATMAAEAPTAFRLHRLYTDGVVLSKVDAAVRGFAFGGSQVSFLSLSPPPKAPHRNHLHNSWASASGVSATTRPWQLPCTCMQDITLTVHALAVIAYVWSARQGDGTASSKPIITGSSQTADTNVLMHALRLQVTVTLLDAMNSTVASGKTTADGSGAWRAALGDLKPGVMSVSAFHMLWTGQQQELWRHVAGD